MVSTLLLPWVLTVVVRNVTKPADGLCTTNVQKPLCLTTVTRCQVLPSLNEAWTVKERSGTAGGGRKYLSWVKNARTDVVEPGAAWLVRFRPRGTSEVTATGTAPKSFLANLNRQASVVRGDSSPVGLRPTGVCQERVVSTYQRPGCTFAVKTWNMPPGPRASVWLPLASVTADLKQ